MRKNIYMHNVHSAAAARHVSHFTGDDYRRDSKRPLKVIHMLIIMQKIAAHYSRELRNFCALCQQFTYKFFTNI